jgi:microcystin degradation protein MlrC
MSLTRPRIAILGMHLESNVFAPVVNEEDFRKSCYLEGEAMLAEAAKPAPKVPAEIPGFVEAMNASGPWEPLPILIAATEPGGAVAQDFIDAVLARIRTLLAAAGPLDGIYISSHGAMTATGIDDPDGALFEIAREAVGSHAPVLATVDLHANISQRMFDCADCILSYRTNPHVDRRERGQEAGGLMRRLLAGERWEKSLLRLPIVPPSVTLLTASGVFADMIAEGQRQVGPDIPVVSVLGGFAFSDARQGGLCVLAYGRGDRPKRLARHLAGIAWAGREHFRVRLTPLEEAVYRAVAAGRNRVRAGVCLADVADNPGGGGRGNTTDILERLLATDAENVLMGNFVDPAAAAACHAAGAGARLRLIFNEQVADRNGRAVAVDAEVLSVSDGLVVGRRGLYAGRTVDLGLAAAIRVEGITLVLCSRRIQCADPAFFETFGLDIKSYSSLVVKSRGHFRAGFDRWYDDSRILEVDAAGLTSPLLERFEWKRLPRPVWPLDRDVQWQTPA